MAFIAGKDQKIGDSIRRKGELVPEAEGWNHINSWIDAGVVVFVPDEVVEYYKDNPDAIAKVPYLAIPQPDAHIEAVYQHKNTAIGLAPDVVDENADSVEYEDSDEDGDDTSDEEDTDSESPELRESEETVEYIDDPSEYNAKDVIDYAKEHPEHAEMLYDAESEGKNRKTVLDGLKALVESSAQ